MLLALPPGCHQCLCRSPLGDGDSIRKDVRAAGIEPVGLLLQAVCAREALFLLRAGVSLLIALDGLIVLLHSGTAGRPSSTGPDAICPLGVLLVPAVVWVWVLIRGLAVLAFSSHQLRLEAASHCLWCGVLALPGQLLAELPPPRCLCDVSDQEGSLLSRPFPRGIDPLAEAVDEMVRDVYDLRTRSRGLTEAGVLHKVARHCPLDGLRRLHIAIIAIGTGAGGRSSVRCTSLSRSLLHPLPLPVFARSLALRNWSAARDSIHRRAWYSR